MRPIRMCLLLVLVMLPARTAGPRAGEPAPADPPSPGGARKSRLRRVGRLILGSCLVGALAGSAGAEDLGLRVADGFRVSVHADQDLADDVYALTLDARGRVVVTTRGSIKILHDVDGDGRADRATPFAETATGGMGLCFDEDDLMFCGDGWLSRYRDSDGDGRADGAPRRLIPLRFGEHGGHAMRKGPDGWWYVVAGNDAEVDQRHAHRPTSPIVEPEAGAFLRLPPDFGTCQVIAQGFRNPYDFDFEEATKDDGVISQQEFEHCVNYGVVMNMPRRRAMELSVEYVLDKGLSIKKGFLGKDWFKPLRGRYR